MKLNGSELISKGTESAARLCTATSAIVIVLDRYSFPTENFELLGYRFPETAYYECATVILVFLTVSLLVNWSGDYVSYRNWFKSNNFSSGDLFGIGPDKNTIPPLESIKDRLKSWRHYDERLQETISKLESLISDQELMPSFADESDNEQQRAELKKQSRLLDDLKEKVEGFETSVDTLQASLSHASGVLGELDVRFARTDFWAKFQIFGWYLGLPIFLVLFAIFTVTFPLLLHL